MFCSNCGKEVGDNKFCTGCGRAMIQEKKKKAKWPIFVVLGILLVGIGLVVVWAVTRENEDETVKEVLEENINDDIKESNILELGANDNTESKTEENDSDIENVDITEEFDSAVYLLKNENSVELGTLEQVLNAEEIYANLTYMPQMFYGNYEYNINGREKDWLQKMSLMDFEGKKITAIPHSWQAGPGSTMYGSEIIACVRDKNWVEVEFVRDIGVREKVVCEYKIKENKVILNPVNWNYDSETGLLTYSMTDIFWEYDFAFKGMELTLSAGGNSVTMNTGVDWNFERYFGVTAYISEESSCIDDIEEIYIVYVGGEDGGMHIRMLDEYYPIYECVGMIAEDGLFTFTIPWKNEMKTYQFVYFYCGSDGLVLTDGEAVYYYNETYITQTMSQLGDNLIIEDLDKLESMSEADVEEVIEKRDNLLEDLAEAYRTAGMSVNVDEDTGEIALDSAILFGVDEYAVSDIGKDFLEQFIEVYTSVVFSDTYKDFVSKIMIEGHTDTSGSYEVNEELSRKRAESVRDYCVGVVGNNSLEDILQAAGYSYNKPIYDEMGNVDMEASRRVSFRFMINLDN